MRIKGLVLSLAFLLVFSLPAGAGEVLTWEGCAREALKNHPDLIAARESLAQAKSSQAITRSSLLPQISGSVSERTSKSGGKETDSYSYSISGSQLLFDGFKTTSDLAAARESVKAAEYSYESTSEEVRLSLKTAFANLLKAQELLELTRAIAERRGKNTELVRLRYEAGREHRGSLLTAEANLAQAEFEVARAERNVELARRELSLEMGRPRLIPLQAMGDFEIRTIYEEKENIEELAESWPSLKRYMSLTEQTRFNLKSARADFSPTVSATGSKGRSGSDWPPDDDSWSVGVSVSIPIFEGGSKFAKLTQKQSALEEAKANERGKWNEIIINLENNWKGLKDALDKVKVRKKFLEAAEERAQIAQAQYSAGLISFDDWTIIEDSLVSAKKSYLDAQVAAVIAEATWLRLPLEDNVP